jgi:hypothetical protein
MRRKLKLNKETLRALTVRNLEGIPGGLWLTQNHYCSGTCDQTALTCYESCKICSYTCESACPC